MLPGSTNSKWLLSTFKAVLSRFAAKRRSGFSFCAREKLLFELMGLKENLQNVVSLSNAHRVAGESIQLTSLKRQLNAYLSGLQPEFVTADRLEFTGDADVVNRLVPLFRMDSNLNDLSQGQVILDATPNEAVRVERAREAFVALRALAPDVAQLFELVISRCFCAPSSRAGGGSSSAAIGAIWINPRESWTTQDYIEFMIHEMTHHLLFLDERRYLHYLDYNALKQPENFAFSAILRRSRPLDKVVHSLIVAFEVLSFRTKHFDLGAKTYLHPTSDELRKGCMQTLDSLKTLRTGLLSPRAYTLISKVEQSLQSHVIEAQSDVAG